MEVLVTFEIKDRLGVQGTATMQEDGYHYKGSRGVDCREDLVKATTNLLEAAEDPAPENFLVRFLQKLEENGISLDDLKTFTALCML